MTDTERSQDHGIRTIEEFSSGLARDYAIIAKSNRDAASRIVWFVAISGFAFINMRQYAEAVVGNPLNKAQLFSISLPWALTAIAGVAAHWLLGELIARDNEFHILRQHAIRSFLANAQANPSIDEIMEILNVDETDEEVALRKRRLNAIFPWVTWAERMTFAFLLLGFACTLILPLVF